MSIDLSKAVSAETAHVVEDYPYGFRLRCKLRAWIEYKAGKGFRYVTQTTNPKVAGEVWNKPKASTYARVCGTLMTDEQGHIGWASLTEYDDLAAYTKFFDRHQANMSLKATDSFLYFEAIKKAYEDKKTELGVDNIYTATREQRDDICKAWMTVAAAQVAAGRKF